MKYFCVILIIIHFCDSKTNRLYSNYNDNNFLVGSRKLNCTALRKIEDVEVTLENNILLVTWDTSPNSEDCHITYELKIYENHRQVYAVNTTQTTYGIDFPFIGCKLYYLVIFYAINDSKTPLRTVPILVPKESYPPKCDVTEVENNYAVLECALISSEESMCNVSEIVVECQAVLENINYLKESVIVNRTEVYTIKNSLNKESIKIKIANLDEYTNYTCSTVTTTSDGLASLSSPPIVLQTKEGVPDAPILYDISSITNTTFHIQWESPRNIPGVLTNYRITVHPKEPLYDIPEDCPAKNNTIYTHEVSSMENEYTVKDAFPSYEYEVFVQAKTFDYGPPSEAEQVLTYGGSMILYQVNQWTWILI